MLPPIHVIACYTMTITAIFEVVVLRHPSKVQHEIDIEDAFLGTYRGRQKLDVKIAGQRPLT